MATHLNLGLRRLDRYVLGEVLRPWLGLCLFFYFTLLLFQALRLSDCASRFFWRRDDGVWASLFRERARRDEGLRDQHEANGSACGLGRYPNHPFCRRDVIEGGALE